MNPVDEEGFEEEVAPSEVCDGRLNVGVTPCSLFNLRILFLQTINLHTYVHIFNVLDILFPLNLSDQYEEG